MAAEVRNADLIATAVGAAALPKIAGALAEGLLSREDPINVLICENLPDAAGRLRELLIAEGGQFSERARIQARQERQRGDPGLVG